MTLDEIVEHLAKLQAMKEYIFVLDVVENHMVPVVVAHAVLTAHREFKDNPDYRHWHGNSYKKCVCKVNAAEMRKVLATPLVSTTTERNYGEQIIAAVLCPRLENPNVAKFAKLWKPNYEPIRSSTL